MSDLKEFDEVVFKNTSYRLDQPSLYLVRKARRDPDGYENLKKSVTSGTVYIGKLSVETTEEQLYELFSRCGVVKKIIMGLDRYTMTPTGFCFIIFANSKGALSAVKYLNGTRINGRSMAIDLDPGFTEGRQFGRGENGGQRTHTDTRSRRGARGGYRRQNSGYRERRHPSGSYRSDAETASGPGVSEWENTQFTVNVPPHMSQAGARGDSEFVPPHMR
ncbi:unnamed protein product [Kuraishia capsulata CBS 1993]|uniref:Nuclear cap-binding protein subunit 2 n=1 Tax=Kuraishia capsulata CBS 1993 TaxID=1382522 RepID=W6MQ58_9ASCO|nr:uncharacterized protein KUCA_T00004796001 [Kuraishia capsulata CBS 1993]CDK28811.1 unnamed protein product [Kuraishia capsulata CBS 1993]